MSMQYLSSSTIRCRPRIWPSIRRSRLRWLDFSEVYPWTCSSLLMTAPLYPHGVCRHAKKYPLWVSDASPGRYLEGVWLHGAHNQTPAGGVFLCEDVRFEREGWHA